MGQYVHILSSCLIPNLVMACRSKLCKFELYYCIQLHSVFTTLLLVILLQLFPEHILLFQKTFAFMWLKGCRKNGMLQCGMELCGTQLCDLHKMVQSCMLRNIHNVHTLGYEGLSKLNFLREEFDIVSCLQSFNFTKTGQR